MTVIQRIIVLLMCIHKTARFTLKAWCAFKYIFIIEWGSYKILSKLLYHDIDEELELKFPVA